MLPAFAPAPPPGPKRLGTASAWFLAALATWLFWPGRGMDLGLHGDEAWVGLRAAAIAQGARPSAFGMNHHTGPLHQLLVACAFLWTGPTQLALRAVGACANGAALALFAVLLSRRHGRTVALWAYALACSHPFVRAFAPIAIEIFAVLPLLAALAWLCIDGALRATRPGHRRSFAWLAGALLGVGTWTHLVFVAVPAAWLAVAAASLGRRCYKNPLVWHVASAWAAVEVLPLVAIGRRIKVRGGLGGVGGRMAECLPLLVRTHLGDAGTLRLLGSALGHGIVWWAGVALLSLSAMSLAIHAPSRRRAWPLGVALVAHLAATAVVAPFMSDRFLFLAVIMLAPLAAMGLDALSHLTRAPQQRMLAHALCALWLTLQVAQFDIYFAQPWRDGRAIGNSYLGAAGVLESSNHYLPTQSLYDELVARGAHQVICQNFIGWALRFYDLPHHALDINMAEVGDPFEATAEGGPRTTYVRYAEGLCVPLVTQVPKHFVHIPVGHFELAWDPAAQATNPATNTHCDPAAP